MCGSDFYETDVTLLVFIFGTIHILRQHFFGYFRHHPCYVSILLYLSVITFSLICDPSTFPLKSADVLYGRPNLDLDHNRSWRKKLRETERKERE